MTIIADAVIRLGNDTVIPSKLVFVTPRSSTIASAPLVSISWSYVDSPSLTCCRGDCILAAPRHCALQSPKPRHDRGWDRCPSCNKGHSSQHASTGSSQLALLRHQSPCTGQWTGQILHPCWQAGVAGGQLAQRRGNKRTIVAVGRRAAGSAGLSRQVGVRIAANASLMSLWSSLDK